MYKPTYSLLVVEDDKIILESLVELLSDFCPEVFTASNGAEALKIYEEEKIDILITDITMPVMDGIELVTQIRKLNETIPIAILSANNEPEFFIKSIDLNVDGYLLKPVKVKKVIELVERFIDRLDKENLQLKNSQLMEQYKDIIDQNTIVSKSDVNGVITYVNEAMANLTEYSVDELVGKNHNIIRHPDTSKKVFQDMWSTILAKKVWKGTLKNKKKSGAHYWVDVVINPILDEAGEILEFIAIRKDVTLEIDYKISLEQQVSEQVEKLRMQDQLMVTQSKQAAMGEMIDAIAHQWKQPLNTIALKSDFLVVMHKGEASIPYNEVKECKDVIQDKIEHLVETLNEFRDFLRPNKKVEKFFLTKTINSVLLLLQDDIKIEEIRVNVDIQNELVVHGIENEFKHVLINLISNAKDAFIENGIQDRKVKITTSVQNDVKRLIVQDNAGGIPQDIIENIFDAHVTTKEESAGTGIGLYMTKQILDKHNISISVKNQDNGACFTFEF